jgi:hypothetical protein
MGCPMEIPSNGPVAAGEGEDGAGDDDCATAGLALQANATVNAKPERCEKRANIDMRLACPQFF